MRHLRVLRAGAIAALAVSIPSGASYLTDTATGDVPRSEVNPVVIETDAESSGGMGDVFYLDVPGTYSAFAIGSSRALLTEVRGSGNELLATSHPTMATAGAVDLALGFRFGISAPQVFKVDTSATIHVEHDDSPYELVLVRAGSTPEFSRLNVRPPVERVVEESGSCLAGDLREIFRIHTDAVYSDTVARQVFVVDSPDRSSITAHQFSGTADRRCRSLPAWPSPTTTRSLLTSRFFAIR